MSQRTFSIVKPDAVRKGYTASILAAIETHDPPGAGVAMEFHLDLGRLLSHISTTQNINPGFFAAPEPAS